MNAAEFNREFDIIYNNASNNAPNINHYEKSVFLTNAQEEIISNYFNPKGNRFQEGFNDSPKRDMDLSGLINIDILKPITEILPTTDRRGVLFILDCLYILNETAIVDNKPMIVINLEYQEYTRLMSKSFKAPLKNQVWRLTRGIVKGGSSTKPKSVAIELISKELNASGKSNITEYQVRYVDRPNPIILFDLPTGLSIDGKSTASATNINESPCMLPNSLHRTIINRAVEMACVAYGKSPEGHIAINQRNE